MKHALMRGDICQSSREASPLTAEAGAGLAVRLRPIYSDGCDGDGDRCA